MLSLFTYSTGATEVYSSQAKLDLIAKMKINNNKLYTRTRTTPNAILTHKQLCVVHVHNCISRALHCSTLQTCRLSTRIMTFLLLIDGCVYVRKAQFIFYIVWWF